MIVFFLILLLLIFLAGFFGLEPYIQNVMQQADVRVAGFSLLDQNFRVFLGLGILFLEFAVIIFSMLDRIGSTIMEIIRAVIKFVPFILFLSSIWRTFSPILSTLLPPDVADAFGIASSEASVAQIVNSESFSLGVILTLGTMFLFIITNYALARTAENSEVRALRSELAKARREARRGL